jgi:hypothetical protein
MRDVPTCPICNRGHPMAGMAALVQCDCGHIFDAQGDFDPVAERVKREMQADGLDRDEGFDRTEP